MKSKIIRNKSIFFFIATVILWIWALSYIFIIVWAIFSSLRNGIAFAINDSSIFGFTDKKEVPFIEHIYSFDNFVNAFRELKDDVTGTTFFGMFVNSTWITLGFIVCSMVIRITTAYALAMYDFKGRSAIHKFFILQMIIPTFGSDVANYRFLFNLGLLDSPLWLLSCIAGHGMTMIILYSGFVGFSKSYGEAARIDGASEFGIFLRIYMPMAKSLILAMSINTFIGVWQDYTTPMIYLTSYPTLATGLFKYTVRAAYVSDTPTYFAGILIANIPVTILFIVFNKAILENITIGGLKG